MLSLNLQSLIRPTTTVLQVVDTTTIRLEGILEDITINIKYWEYPRNFVVIEVKSKLRGYPLNLGKSLLATIDAYIGCRSRDMTITSGKSKKEDYYLPPFQTFHGYNEKIFG